MSESVGPPLIPACGISRYKYRSDGRACTISEYGTLLTARHAQSAPQLPRERFEVDMAAKPLVLSPPRIPRRHREPAGRAGHRPRQRRRRAAALVAERRLTAAAGRRGLLVILHAGGGGSDGGARRSHHSARSANPGRKGRRLRGVRRPPACRNVRAPEGFYTHGPFKEGSKNQGPQSEAGPAQEISQRARRTGPRVRREIRGQDLRPTRRRRQGQRAEVDRKRRARARRRRQQDRSSSRRSRTCRWDSSPTRSMAATATWSAGR